MLNDILDLLKSAPSRKAEGEPHIKVELYELRQRLVEVKKKEPAWYHLADGSVTNPLFCAPWDEELDHEIDSLLAQIRDIRNDAAAREGAITQRIFALLREKREGR